MYTSVHQLIGICLIIYLVSVIFSSELTTFEMRNMNNCPLSSVTSWDWSKGVVEEWELRT